MEDLTPGRRELAHCHRDRVDIYMRSGGHLQTGIGRTGHSI